MDNTGMSTEEIISEATPPLYASYDDKHDVDKLRRIAQALEHDGSVMIRTKDGRIVKVMAIIYDGERLVCNIRHGHIRPTWATLVRDGCSYQDR